MKINLPEKIRNNKPGFRDLSIQQKLPLLICVLLICIVVALGWLSEIGVKRATLAMGKERLGALTEQLSSLFGQSAALITTMTRTAANQEPVKNFLSSNAAGSDTAAQQVLDKLRLDSTWILVDLFNANRQPLLRSAPKGLTTTPDSRAALSAVSLGPDSCKVGKFYRVKDAIYFPILAAVTEKKRVLGYLVRWRLQVVTPTALAQFSQLLGTNATLYLGNSDGSLWTDMIHSVAAPPTQIQSDHQFFEYTRPGKEGAVIASAAAIPNTQWTMLIEFSEGIMLEASRRFLPWVISIGALLVAMGILLAWLTSRNITRPLNKLTDASTAMAAGDYTVSVEIDRSDELGKLARAFNEMAIQVKNAQRDLEKKVQERTQQLSVVNKELEAFSYSVSHDLRAPLRYINGYAEMLKEDYARHLDAEANRITDKIISSARKMGQLIDDLISFSQMARKELKFQSIDMGELARACTSELLQQEPENKYQVLVHDLPACMGDAGLIKQVWVNLIGNAIKYSSKNPAPYIEIGHRQAPGGSFYFIRDNGVGFDMKYADKLFGVFQRLHNQAEFEGLGIGLSLVKRIINRHNGEINAEATLGEGAAFYFSLPGTNGYE